VVETVGKPNMDAITKTSICFRCGKQRIVLSTTNEKVGNSNIVTKETICPDPECQKKVEVLLKQEADKRRQSNLLKESRLASRVKAKIERS